MIHATPHSANKAATIQAPWQKEFHQPTVFSSDRGDGSSVGVGVAGPPGVKVGRGVAVGGWSIRTVGVWGGTVGRITWGVGEATGVGVSTGREFATK